MSQARQEAREPAATPRPSLRAPLRALREAADAASPPALAIVLPIDRHGAASPGPSDRRDGCEALVEALLAADPAEARSWPLGDALLALMVPAAQRLGELWVEDEIGFCEVTLAMHRLTLQLIDLEMRDDAARQPAHGGRVLLAPAPDDQHSFGTAYLGFHLRRAGWDVCVEHGGAAAVLAALGARPFALLGLSIGHERAVAPAAALIGQARLASRNPALWVAVGGAMLSVRPELPAFLGADFWTANPSELVEKISPLAGGG